MSERDDLAHRLEVAVDSNEKHRSRARSIAALCAASAGALAAGLVLAPAEAIPKLAQVLGLGAITLLIVATAFSVAASSASSYQNGVKRSVNFLHSLEAWRIRTKSPQGRGVSPTYEDLIQDAGAIKNGIVGTLSWGLWSASFAAIALVGALAVATFVSDASRLVTLELKSTPDVSSCPSLGQIVRGEIWDRDRASSANLLPVKILAEDCGNSVGATLYLDKSLVAIVG